jgi:hypothetical protein
LISRRNSTLPVWCWYARTPCAVPPA